MAHRDMAPCIREMSCYDALGLAEKVEWEDQDDFELPHFDWDRSPQIFPMPPAFNPGYMGWVRFLSDGRMITALPTPPRKEPA